jgi:hypothetical protein
MNLYRFAAACMAAGFLGAVGCGSSGTNTSRPIETLIYVSGATGTPFAFADTPDPSACGSVGTGIQAPNTSHQFGSRVFQTPHLFVMENVFQPVRAVIRNLDPSVDLTVDLYLGQTPQQPNKIIKAGECQTIVSDPKELPYRPEPPVQLGPQVQVEICTPIDNSQDPPRQNLDISCLQSTVDRHIAFFATIGDLANSNITNCTLNSEQPGAPPLLDACRGPSTFFLEQPKDQIDAVMSVNAGQNPGGNVPPAQLRLELYVNDPVTPVDIDHGENPAVTDTL